ncbi:MAG: oligopeptide/dipeptide ABC transporter ATP-binding protein [Pseudomonadota bacterium]
MSESPLLVVRRLTVRYPQPRLFPWRARHWRNVVDGIDFNLHAGETLGIVGESGCGKSSLAKALLGVQPIASGAAIFNGVDLAKLDRKSWKPLRREIQMVFQDPLASLDPRMRVGKIIEQPLAALRPDIDKAERPQRIAAALERVGLNAADMQRHVHEFSGGQCQRIGLARALVVEPKLLVCDEPVSALDVSVQAQVINLLADLQRDLGLAMVFIGHDLAVVRQMSQRVLVMYAGTVMEQGPRERLFTQPMHPYTKALMAAVPGHVGSPTSALVSERAPAANPGGMTLGCRYRDRCAVADDYCGQAIPALRRTAPDHFAACHFAGSQTA